MPRDTILMFGRITKLTRDCRERLVSVVLVPAFLIGTMPQTACICADGHREEFCKAGVCRTLSRGPTTAACCGCSCCKTIDSAHTRACCQAKGAKHKTPPASGIAARSSSCCKPVVQCPAPVIQSVTSDEPAHLKFVAAIEMPPSATATEEFRPALVQGAHSTPPPLDAVIVFLHLTI